MTLAQLVSTVLLATSVPVSDDPLVGRFRLDGEVSDDPAAAVEAVVGSMSRFTRQRARSRLSAMMTPADELEIWTDGDAYLMSGGDGPPLHLVPGGPAVEVERPDGDRATVSTTRDGESLVISMALERGTRIQTLTPEEDGLRVEVRYDLDVADEPVSLEFRYRRVQP